MAFENPLFLFFIPAALFIIWFSGIRKGRGGIIQSAWGKGRGETLQPTGGTGNALLFKSVRLLYCLSILLVAFSLSGPYKTEKKSRYLSAGSDYFILLDISPSMAVAEGGKTRLEMAKEAAIHIADASGNDYPGLILFGSSTVVALLPTPDKSEFLSRLASARVMDLGDATAMGTALGKALFYLKGSASEKKRIILISDGGNNYGELPPLDAAKMALELGIRISCVAVGSSAPEREIVIERGDGETVSGKVRGSYQPGMLEVIAEKTGGYFLDNPGILALGQMASALKSGNVKTETVFMRKEGAMFFLISGVLILFAVMLLKVFVLRELMP